jgi:hypothetical protein
MMLLVERETQEGLLVAVCDPDDLGRTYANGDVELEVDPEFYDGESATPEEVVDALSRCAVANLVGTESVSLAVERGFVDETNVLEFEGTRHAQLLRM